MDMHTQENKLMVSVKNFPEFQRLLDQAKREAEQLNSTIAQLSRFDFEFSFSVVDDQAGDMDAASSARDSSTVSVDTVKRGSYNGIFDEAVTFESL